MVGGLWGVGVGSGVVNGWINWINVDEYSLDGETRRDV